MEKEKDNSHKISGDDIVHFLRKIFGSTYSKKVSFKDENNKTYFKINFILLILILLILPILALILIIYLIITNDSIHLETKKEKSSE